MNRTIKDATVKRFHYDNQDQLRLHLADFVAVSNVARRLKIRRGLTPYKAICKTGTEKPCRFKPIHTTKVRDQTARRKTGQPDIARVG